MIPNSIRYLLEDYVVAKLQSRVAGDVRLLDKVGIRVQGIVDSGTIYIMVRPGPISSGAGTRHQINSVWSSETLLDQIKPVKESQDGSTQTK